MGEAHYGKTLAEKQKAERKGRRAEFWARFILRMKRYKILEANYKTYWGEVDIITVHKGTLVVFEVKARNSLEECYAALQPVFLRRIEEATRKYQASRPELQNLPIRYDAVFVVPPISVVHMPNAWISY